MKRFAILFAAVLFFCTMPAYGMVCLDNSDTLEGGASVDAVVDYTVHGMVSGAFTNIAQGQLSDTDPSVLYTAATDISIVSVIYVNTHSAAVTVNLYLDPTNAGTPRRMIPEALALQAGYSMVFDGQRCTVIDTNGGIVSGVNVSDTAYGAGWDTITTVAPSKNAIYDALAGGLVTPAFNGLSAGDANITNVGNIALDSISSDAGTTVNVDLGSDAGDDFTVDGTKLVVKGDTGKVGIGTAIPDTKLDIEGTARASTGILFGTDTAAANTLDDYEEGYYIATLTCGTSGTITMLTNYDTMSYTKIGRKVTIQGYIRVASVSSPVGSLSLNVPIAKGSLQELSDAQSGVISYYSINALGSPGLWLDGSGTGFYFVNQTTTTEDVNIADNVAANSIFMISATYFTN